MEGSEAGMVAVVQGLRDAGLAVTLLSRRFAEPGARTVLADVLSIQAPSREVAREQVSQTPVETGTETAFGQTFPRDNGYRSSYQLAHCRPVVPSPNRQPHYSSSGFHHYRSSISRTHDEEIFVESLRKYPYISPNRSLSADLIERMLSYTQKKNGTRRSNSRSVKSLLLEKDTQLDEIPTRDNGIPSYDTARLNFGYKRDAELIPAPSGNKKSRHENDTGMYDYLKSNRKDRKLKGSDVRYLTTVKECLKERLRQMCDEGAPTICPKIQSRYNHHRRQHHSNKCPGCQDTMTQASAPIETQNFPSTSSERPKGNRLSTFKHSKACFCDRPQPCDCAPKQSRSILKSKSTPEELIFDLCSRKECMASAPTQVQTDDKHFSKNDLQEKVLEWAQEIPVYANFNTEDRLKREQVINEVIDTLYNMQDDQFQESAEREIKKCLKILPMWRPDNVHEQEVFENRLTNSLLKRLENLKSNKSRFENEISKWVDNLPLKSVSVDKVKIVNDLKNNLETISLRRSSNDEQYRNDLKSEIVRLLNGLPIETKGCPTMFINSLADNLAEKLLNTPLDQSSSTTQSDLQHIILEWVKDIPQLSIDVILNNDDNILVNDLVQNLNSLISSNVDVSGDLLRNNITNWLNTIEEKKGCQIDSNTKKVLTDQLIDKLLHLNVCDIRINNIDDIVRKWFQDNKQDIGIDLNQNELGELTAKLQEFQSVESIQNRQNVMRQEILNWLQNLQKKRGTRIDSVTQENLINKLIGMIRGTETENKLITQKIWEWLNSQQNVPHDISPRYKSMVNELSEKLQSIMDEKGDLAESDIKAEVGTWIDKLSEKHGLKIDIQDRKNLEDQLLSCVKPLKKRKQWSKPENVEGIVKKEVDNIIDEVDIPLKAVDRERLKIQLKKVITDNWNVIHSGETEKLLLEVEKILEEVTSLNKNKIKNLADKLINTIKKATLPEYDKAVRKRTISLDKPLEDKLRRIVTNILHTSSIKNKSEVIDKTIDALSKINTDKDESVHKLVYDILKNTQLNENEAVDITNRLLNIANELRSELTESGEDTTYKSPSFESMESVWIQKQMFMQRLEKEITDFMEKVLNETSSFLREKTSDFITSLQTQTDITATQFKRPLKTSTPKSGSEENVLDIEKETKSSILSGIQVDERMRGEENKYKIQIKEIIRKWLDSLELNGKIDEILKDKITDDIAADIIDRERYIKLSKAKTSNQEEIEHLRYQIFKWTSKLPISNELDIKNSKIKLLIKSLQDAKVPYLNSETSDQEIGSEHEVLIQDNNEFIEEKIYSAILSWINQMSILKPRNSEEKQFIDDLIIELSQSLKNILILEATKNESTVEDLCIKKISKYLKKLKGIAQKYSNESIQNLAFDLLNHLKNVQILALAQKQEESIDTAEKNLRKRNAIKQAVQNWCQKLPLKPGTTYEDIKETADKLAEAISRYLLITDIEDIDSFMNEILNNLKQLPLKFDKEHYKTLPQFTETLIETLKEVLNDSDKYYTLSMQDSITNQSVPKPPHKKAAALIFDNIQEWCENLPLDFEVTNEGFEAHKIKQDIGAKLMKKIGELNLDPELIHEDLYEDVLRDEIEKILDELPRTKNLEAVLPTLKENLTKNLLAAKEEMKTEIAGYAYKQQLRDAISKTLSSIGLPVINETPFEVLKDNLADAFISLHYVADDKELRKKFKEKIFNEVNKFCDDYLMRYPSSPLDANQLNRDLYNALKKVPMPKDESLRREAEHIRMKDVVTDWFKDLPLEERMSHAQEKKIISWLSKRLYEIEKETEFNPELDKDNIMKNEIVKWLKKLRFQTEIDPETVTEKLINNLKATKESRKLDETSIRKSINYADLTSDFENITFLPSIPQRKRPTITSEVAKSSNGMYPPSSLSAEDRAHLERIRQRTPMERPVLIPENRKDAAVSPVPVPTGVQTEEQQTTNNFVFQNISQNASIQTIIKEPEQQIPITPQVIVKEYYWDLSQSSPMNQSGSLLSCSRSPVVTAEGAKQQATRTSPATSQLTTASQTLPSSLTAKATITQETTVRVDTQTPKATITQEPNVRGDLEKSPKIGTSTQTSCLRRLQQLQKERETPLAVIDSHHNPEENLQIQRKGIPCKPCRGRPEASQSTNNQNTIRHSNAIEEENYPENDQQSNVRCKPDCRGRNSVENKYCWDQNEICHQPCFRRRLYETQNGAEQPKRKRKTCSCKSHTTKCTIRPLQAPCEQAHKSCNALLKHCPKCWDGFCPHPSHLYFRRD